MSAYTDRLDRIKRARELLERGRSGSTYRDALNVPNGCSINGEPASAWQQTRRQQADEAAWKAKFFDAFQKCETDEDRVILADVYDVWPHEDLWPNGRPPRPAKWYDK